ncbi:restriction endonuclease subunit S [Stutzerimonas degradans]
MSHYKPYPTYKDSGVEWLGMVPEHWTIGPYKATIQIENGSDYKEVEADDGYPVIGSGGPFAYSSKLMYDGESVLLGRKGTIDKPLYVNGAFWAVDTMYWSIIKPGAHGRFAYYIATTIPFDLYSTNTALPSMTKSVLGSHVVAFPGFEEQQTIAGHLDRETARIDALIEKKTRFIELLREKRQALITHAVTKGLNPNVNMKDSGVEWLGEVPEHWDVGVASRIATRTVVGIAEAATHAYADSGTPILRSTNIRPYKIIGEILHVNAEFADDRDTKLIHAGDLITVRTGNAGVTAVVPPELEGCQCFTMLVTTLKDGMQPDYYCYWMNSAAAVHYFSIEGWGTAQVNISVPILKSLPVPIPPTDEQKRVVDFLHRETQRLDTLLANTERSIDLLKERRAALITAAVTGQIDLREAV